MLKNIKFLSTIEPLRDLLKNEERILLSSIMRKPSTVITPETYIIDVVFQFVKNPHQRVFPVASDGICIGVLSTLDIVTKFLRV
jgi:CBS domain-containing protein